MKNLLSFIARWLFWIKYADKGLLENDSEDDHGGTPGGVCVFFSLTGALFVVALLVTLAASAAYHDIFYFGDVYATLFLIYMILAIILDQILKRRFGSKLFLNHTTLKTRRFT